MQNKSKKEGFNKETIGIVADVCSYFSYGVCEVADRDLYNPDDQL